MKIHIVQKGDTLWKLSKKYGVDFEKLKSANTQLANPDLIMPGMKINIPSSGGVKKKEVVKKEYPIKKETPVKEAPKPKMPVKKEVKKEVPAPAPVPPPQPKPSYHVQQAKVNVNVYKQPSYPKMPTPPPAPKAPKPPVKEVKEQPKEAPKAPPKPAPKPKPKAMAKPKPVEKLPSKKMPAPMPVQKKPMQPEFPKYQGHVSEGCLSMAALCAYPYMHMQPGHMYPQAHMPVMQPCYCQKGYVPMAHHHHQPLMPMNHMAYPQQHYVNHMPQFSQGGNRTYPLGYPVSSNQRSNDEESKYERSEEDNLNALDEQTDHNQFGDLTMNQARLHEAQNLAVQSHHDAFYGMMPWTYPMTQEYYQSKPNNKKEEKD
ncbi:SafA/ExsA family spore coat assembly protein [Salipaludibacillus keqinensis]|uniref:SafA/ExsA family spore coat assembly protein n=1 Tax=Salipaludibacillus keqinensis TaxID=2045207 RepID=UPI001304DFEC|nr:SafA/ExsA family spore coat assembly protein [Salipaludibacillus keqinensis]